MAVVIEAESGRKAQRPIRRQIPGNNRRKVVRRIVQTETVPVTEAAIHLNAGDEVLRAETATLRGRFQRQWTTRTNRIAELPGMATGDVLGGESVFRDVPAAEVLRQEQLGFDFVIVFLTGNGIRNGVVGLDVVAFDF